MTFLRLTYLVARLRLRGAASPLVPITKDATKWFQEQVRQTSTWYTENSPNEPAIVSSSAGSLAEPAMCLISSP